MGRRGPTPTPSAVLRMRGSWRGNSNKSEPQPEIAAPPCPAWLGDDAKVVWEDMLAQLAPLGVLSLIDGNALARYCDVMVKWKKAAAFLQEKGEVYSLKDNAGKTKCIMPWPQVAIYHKLGSMLLKLEQEFGLTPSSRTRIKTDKPVVGDEFDQFMRVVG